MAPVSVSLLGLDAVIGTCSALTITHAVLTRTSFSGLSPIVVCVLILLIALVTEELSIQLGETHCHTEASLMVAPCSSVNSVFFYLPWMYTSFVATQIAFPRGTLTRMAVMGVFQFFFGMCYEVQGPFLRWWRYSDGDVANGAFDERVFGFPVMAAYFHPAFGAGLVCAIDLTAKLSQHAPSPGGNIRGHAARAATTQRLRAIARFVAVLLLAAPIALAYDIPVRILVDVLHVSRFTAVPCLLLLLFLLPFMHAAVAPHPGKVVGSDSALAHVVLAAIPLVWHGYFMATRWWDVRGAKITTELYTIVVSTSLVSLALHTAVFGRAKPKHA